MIYNKTTWVSGDVVTSAKLNNIENGIEAANNGSGDPFEITITVINGVGYSADKTYDEIEEWYSSINIVEESKCVITEIFYDDETVELEDASITVYQGRVTTYTDSNGVDAYAFIYNEGDEFDLYSDPMTLQHYYNFFGISTSNDGDVVTYISAVSLTPLAID